MKRQKGKVLHLHSEHQDVSFYLESSWKHKGGRQEDPLHPMFPKCHHLWTGTFTGEGPSLKSVFIPHWQELFNTENTREEAPAFTQDLEHKRTSKSSFCLTGMCIMKLSLMLKEWFCNSHKGRKLKPEHYSAEYSHLCHKHTHTHTPPLWKKDKQSKTYINWQIQELCHSLHCNSGIIFSHYSNILE